MPSRHLILCRPLLLLHPIPPRIRVFSNESTLHMRWPKYWSGVPLPYPLCNIKVKYLVSVSLEWGTLETVFLKSCFSSVQSLSRVRLFATLWIAARQTSLSITNSWSSLRLASIESVMPSSHLILCRPLPLLPPIPPSIRVFSNESTLRMRWPK